MNTPTRLRDWQIAFEAFIAERSNRPFVWGANDCSTFAADCVKAMCGVDPIPTGLRRHCTEKQALRTLQRHGGLVALASKVLGAPISPNFATVGDVVLIKVGRRDALAICNGSTALGPSSNGLVAVGMAGAIHCWRVPSWQS